MLCVMRFDQLTCVAGVMETIACIGVFFMLVSVCACVCI